MNIVKNKSLLFYHHFYHCGFEPAVYIPPATVAFAGVFHSGVLHFFMGGGHRASLPLAGFGAAIDGQSDTIKHLEELRSGRGIGADLIQHPNLGAGSRIHSFYDHLYYLAQRQTEMGVVSRT